MKKQILSLTLALAIFGGVSAANGDNAGKNDSKKAAASEKAIKNFHRQYKDVSNETWSTLSDVFRSNSCKTVINQPVYTAKEAIGYIQLNVFHLIT